jgi:glucose/arabinose dehydrogenase
MCQVSHRGQFGHSPAVFNWAALLAIDGVALCFILCLVMGGCEGRKYRRRTRSILYGIALAMLIASPARSQSRFTAQRIASGLNRPLYVTAPRGDVNHLFIVQQTGEILVLDLRTGALNRKPFFNIRRRLTSTSGEQGLLGMAFDPNYATNKKFYLNFTVPGGAFGNGVTHVSQFQVQPRKPGKRRKKKIREKILLRFDQPQINHNGGWIGFSPRPGDRNNLYIATGDGGAANDQGTGHIEPGGNAQNNTTLLGKILRVHVNSTLGRISIPPDNPFFGSGTFRPEIWVSGLRNPYRASFDRQNGRMFIGDVGQNTREEVDVQEASNPSGGENYQWRVREGTIATPTGSPPVGSSAPPGSVGPILDYTRSTGGTIIGGYVYRGTAVPALQGKYVFGDFVAGKIFVLDYNGTTASNFQDITSQLFPTRQGGFNLSNPSSFGEDATGELYITDLGGGSVYKIVQ